MTLGMVPDDARQMARSAKYDNSQAEAEAIEAVDERVFSACRTFEDFLANQEQDALQSNTALLEASVDMRLLIRQTRFGLEEGTITATKDAAVAWQRLRGQAEDMVRHLNRSEKAAEWHAARGFRVWQTFNEVLRKYEPLRLHT